MPETTQTVAVESPKSKEPESEIQFLDPSSSYSNFEEEITIIEKNATQKSIVSTPPPPPPSFLDQDDDILDILSSVSDHENPKIPPNVLSSPRKSNPRVSNPLRQDAVMNRINDVMRKIASASSRLRNEDSGLDLDSLESFTQVPESRDGAPSDLYEVAYDNSTRTAYGEMRNEGSDPLLELMQELGSN
ncbi:hypothetical protein GPJ56_003183 [Histomonas meleagridis]|uniref:uncharacterized protein n=1 Tax=Histomonas meleagridis TaxID=135588 RepID=UPI0035594EB7|nr:hypothetical protein GPJ56_003183 [Histomonas meleagridis]KAH0801216.1 hypothetical protein GO595_005811 [Histomonas meleagridis]